MTKTTEAPTLFEEIGEGHLYVGGKEYLQIDDVWILDPVAQRNKPATGGLYVSAHLVQYEGYELCQWFGKLATGLMRPTGCIMRLTAAGHEQLAQETFEQEENTDGQ